MEQETKHTACKLVAEIDVKSFASVSLMFVDLSLNLVSLTHVGRFHAHTLSISISLYFLLSGGEKSRLLIELGMSWRNVVAFWYEILLFVSDV